MITGFLPEVRLAEQAGKRARGASEVYREMIELSVQRFVRKLRVAVSPEARVIIETQPGEECQVDYGAGPMVRDPTATSTGARGYSF